MPTSRAGSFSVGAERLDLNARSVGGQQRTGLELGFDFRVQRPLGLGVFEDGFDHQVGVRNAVTLDVHCEARQCAVHGSGILESFLEERSSAIHGRPHQLRRPILQRHAHPAKCRPRRNIAAHDAGADDVHAFEFGGGISSQTLEAILQHKNAHQIARGRRAHQIADGARLRLIARGTRSAVTLPQIHDGVWGRVVIAPDAASQGRQCPSRNERSHQGGIQGAIQQGRGLLRRGAQQQSFGTRQQLRGRHELIEQSHAARAGPLEGPALEHEIQRSAHTDQTHGAYRAAEPGVQSQQHFRQAQR